MSAHSKAETPPPGRPRAERRPTPLVSFHYDAQLFEMESFALGSARSVQRAASASWQHGEQPLGALSLLSFDEEQRQLLAWSGPQVRESLR